MDEWLKERYDLARNRIHEVGEENICPEPFLDFFQKEAGFLCFTAGIFEREGFPEDENLLAAENRELYADILPENYAVSYGNPSYASEKLGEYGPCFCFLYAELRGTVVFCYEKRLFDMTVLFELFLQIYSAFTDEELPSLEAVRDILISYVNDYCQDMTENRKREAVDPSVSFVKDIVMQGKAGSTAHLYRYGEYITDNEIGLARFFDSLSEDEVEAVAATYTEGYRKGFAVSRKDIRRKKTVEIRYHVGFERMIKHAVRQFEKMGLAPVFVRHASHVINRRDHHRTGYTGAVANPQYDYDHRQDAALYLTSAFVKRRMRSVQSGYEKVRQLAKVMGGPAVIETFGETPFTPVSKMEALLLSEEQKKLKQEMESQEALITNRYIPGEERSFTAIAYPVPEIGGNFEEIFREIIKINNLDSDMYQKIQQKIIDTLDSCEWVEVKGRGDNETDLIIHLHTLEDPGKQTNFENCTADVNIPAGEVFTSPVLAGTGGILHVGRVYLEGMLFKDLKLVFDCGQVIDYTCSNFASEEENRKYIEDNILFHHVKLPMGEFAIGTNTTAYAAARKFGIEGRLPILIAEKMGPHFAVGDTCYSWSEDTPAYNPDGKEIIARDNEISALRKEDISLAYYQCHTDITIPYEELGSIRVVDDEGEMTSIIEDGRFVLPGTEELNKALNT